MFLGSRKLDRIKSQHIRSMLQWHEAIVHRQFKSKTRETMSSSVIDIGDKNKRNYHFGSLNLFNNVARKAHSITIPQVRKKACQLQQRQQRFGLNVGLTQQERSDENYIITEK